MRLLCKDVFLPVLLAVVGVGWRADSFRPPGSGRSITRRHGTRLDNVRSAAAVKLGVGLQRGATTVYLCSTTISSGFLSGEPKSLTFFRAAVMCDAAEACRVSSLPVNECDFYMYVPPYESSTMGPSTVVQVRWELALLLLL